MFIALTIIAHLQNSLKQLKRRDNSFADGTKISSYWPKRSEELVSEQRCGYLSHTDCSPDITMSRNTADNGELNGNDKQVIVFIPNDMNSCQTIHTKDVEIITSAGQHDHGSSKVKLTNLIDYKWEEKHYPGRLIAVHHDGKYVAYAINVNNKAARMEGMIRVMSPVVGIRALIKGMFGEVLDLQFANISKIHLLASIDLNSLYVHKINLIEKSLLWNLILKVEDPLLNYNPKFDKIVWCPFVSAEAEDDDDDESQMILWSRGNIMQCFDVKSIVSKHGTGIIQPAVLKTGYIKFVEDSLVTWVNISPDGTTLAAACTDGIVRFYQIYMFDDKNKRCLHKWPTHDGKPLSSLFFLDNINKDTVDTYWKYAITATDNNTEFRVWDCSSWVCLQTVKFCTSNKNQQFIAEIDRTASYLVVTSLETRAAYILQIIYNSNMIPNLNLNNTSENLEQSTNEKNNIIADIEVKGTVHCIENASELSSNCDKFPVCIKSIAEFPLSSGILSFSIGDAAVRRLKCSNDGYLNEELDDYDDDSNSIYSVVLHMFIVQSKSMQECRIMYQPPIVQNVRLINNSIDWNELVSIKNMKEEFNDNINEIKRENLSTESNTLDKIISANKLKQNLSNNVTSSPVVAVAAAAAAAPSAVAQDTQLKSHSTSPQNAQKAYLMTPDAFKSSSSTSNTNEKKTLESVSSEVLNTILMLAGVTSQSQSQAQAHSQANTIKNENDNIISLVNNKVIEDQEQHKLHVKQSVDEQKNFKAIGSDSCRNIPGSLASAGSSPSREVEEIMSINEDKFLDEVTVYMEEMAISSLIEEMETNIQKGESAITTAESETSNPNWPKVPEAHKVHAKHSAELQNAANIMSQTVNVTNINSVPPSLGIGTGIGSILNTCSNNNLSNLQESSSVDFNDINTKLNHLIDLAEVQSKQIYKLQCDISDLKKENEQLWGKNFSEFGFKLELQLSKLMEQYLKRFENEHKKKFTILLQGRDVQAREIRDSCIQIVSQYVFNQFSEVVAKVINIEFQRQMAPMLAAKLDHTQQQIQIDVAQKLSTFDLVLKDNIAQVCKSKHFIDAFGKSVLVGVQNSMQTAFIESMGSTLIPAYEKSSQMMFKQLHDAFTIGIKDFLVQIDTYLKHLKPMQDSSEQMINKFGTVSQKLESILAQYCNVVADAMQETQKEIKSFEIMLGRQVQETIRSELRKSFDGQSVVIRSQTNTPAPIYDMKETIKHLLNQGQINKAFHQTLLANDLNLVEYTLRHADITTVFTPKCCLEQKVLLSLIQQISADMSNHNECKQNYLSEALLAINFNDPITQEHAPKVLQDLYLSCQLFLKNYPKSPQCSNIRMTMKTVHSYINQIKNHPHI